MWKLVIEDDEGKRTVVPLTREQYSIGRKDGNTIRLTERNVSRDHARLLKNTNGAAAAHGGDSGRAYVLEDLTSYNGVFVNGLRITHAQGLAHGDLIQIGDYRIVLQDDAVAEAGAPAVAAASDQRETVPPVRSAALSAATLLDRPNRLVMLAGPTPGAEYALDPDRLTIGRAEDANISVNHNSVSRLHCEVHALGEARFEIVDKESSNGVRVNGADLRRGIVEPGDVIELGDVKFKLIGAGQVFRPTESQQLAAIGDRRTDHPLQPPRSPNALPFAIFAIVVIVGGGGVWLFARQSHEPAPSASASPAEPSSDQALLDEAQRMCAAGDCLGAHDKLAGIPSGSAAERSDEFRGIEIRWADAMLKRADAEEDIARRRAMYQRVASTTTVDTTRRKAAADRIQQLDAVASTPVPLALPATPVKSQGERATATRPEGPRAAAPQTPEEHAAPAPPTTAAAPTPSSPAAAPAAATTPGPGSGVTERERQLALQDSPEARMLRKQQLEARVYGGRATEGEIRLLISTCKELADKLCVSQVRAIQQQRQNNQ